MKRKRKKEGQSVKIWEQEKERGRETQKKLRKIRGEIVRQTDRQNVRQRKTESRERQ